MKKNLTLLSVMATMLFATNASAIEITLPNGQKLDTADVILADRAEALGLKSVQTKVTIASDKFANVEKSFRIFYPGQSAPDYVEEDKVTTTNGKLLDNSQVGVFFNAEYYVVKTVTVKSGTPFKFAYSVVTQHGTPKAVRVKLPNGSSVDVDASVSDRRVNINYEFKVPGKHEFIVTAQAPENPPQQ